MGKADPITGMLIYGLLAGIEGMIKRLLLMLTGKWLPHRLFDKPIVKYCLCIINQAVNPIEWYVFCSSKNRNRRKNPEAGYINHYFKVTAMNFIQPIAGRRRFAAALTGVISVIISLIVIALCIVACF